MQWISVLLALVIIGLAATTAGASGAQRGRAEVANECRQAGAFTVKRSAFRCEVIR